MTGRNWFFAATLAACLSWGQDATSTPYGDRTPPELCRQAAALAASQSNVPLRVLLAITLTETGRKRDGAFVPWPWTLNIEGDGFWFDSRAEAVAAAEQALRAGRVSFDTGCFQVNYRWHGEAFDSIEDMLDPAGNALYAARFLTRLHAELGDWSAAAGAYHSRTPRHATRYRAIFDRHFAALGDDLRVPALPRHARRRPAPDGENAFPLLRAGAAPRSAASLVPVQPGTGGLLSRARPLWSN